MIRERKSINIIKFWIVLIVFLFVLSFPVRFYHKFKDSLLKDIGRLNFVFGGREGFVFAFSIENKEITVVTLPSTKKIELTRGFGEYEIGKIYSLGNLDNKGGELLKESIQEYLKIPIFGYFYDDDLFFSEMNVRARPKDVILRILSKSLRGKTKTDINKIDLVFLFLKMFRFSNGKIEVIGEENFSEDVFEDKTLRRESLSFEVLNATDHGGLARSASGLLSRSGARVVRVADAFEKRERCFISFNPAERESYTLKWLKTVFKDCDFGSFGDSSPRADFRIVIGEDYWKLLSEKW